MSQVRPSPFAFLADEIAETSRLTRELTAAAGHAIATLAEQTGDEETRHALHRLMIALQAQDRVEQRLSRLGAFAKTLGAGTNGLAQDTMRRTLALDELVAAFERHMGRVAVAGGNGSSAQDEVELF